MAEPLWSLADVVAASGGETTGPPAPAITAVSIDSRTLVPGALFVAIRGEARDGHAFVADAFERGAAAALVARDAPLAVQDRPVIRVDDTLEGLRRLARAARARACARIIAVTGSVGKTGTKEALRLALTPSGRTHASPKSYNNHWGVPLSLSELPADARFGVFEIGMNHAGEIAPLVRLVRPHVAIVTTVEPVHLGHFNSVEEIAEAKAEIFAGLEPGGTAVLNRDNRYFDLLRRRAEACGAGTVIAFGAHSDTDARLLGVEPVGEGTQVTARIAGRTLSYRLAAPGRHLALNSLAVLAAAQAVGADLEAAAAALADYRPPPGRGARKVFRLAGGPVMVIDESYNANPASMRAALAVLGQAPRDPYRRRLAVLGDMLELGGAGPGLHRDLAQAVDAAGVDGVFACGPLMAELFEALPDRRRAAYAATSEALRPALLAAVGPGDAVMIKGSLGSRMGPLVEALEDHLSRLSRAR